MLSTKPANISDAALINKLAWIAFPHTYRDMLSTEQIDYMMEWMYSIPNLEKQIADKNHSFFIAYKNNNPCGYLHIEKETEDIFKLQKIYVLPDFQGQKIGEFLFKTAIREIKLINSNPSLMKLHVNRDNKAVLFYQRMGMTKIGTGDFEIGNGYYMNDYIMGMEI